MIHEGVDLACSINSRDSPQCSYSCSRKKTLIFFFLTKLASIFPGKKSEIISEIEFSRGNSFFLKYWIYLRKPDMWTIFAQTEIRLE